MAIKDVIKQMEKKFGKGSVRLASDISIERMPTQSIGINLATGGGFPIGKILFISGNPSTGKSSFVYGEIASYQKTFGLPCALVDSEASADIERLTAFGVDVDNLLVENPVTLEEGLDKVLFIVREADIGLLAVDSLAMLSPEKENVDSKDKSKSLTDDNVAVRARVLNKFFRRLVASLNYAQKERGRCPTIIMVQQWYVSSIGVYGVTRDFSGGAAQKYISHLTVDFRQPYKAEGGSDLEETVEVEENGKMVEKVVKVGLRVVFDVKKSKFSQDKTTGLFSIFTMPTLDRIALPGVNRVDECCRYGVKYGVIKKAGNWLEYGDLKTNGVQSFSVQLWQRPDLQKDIEMKIYEASGVSVDTTKIESRNAVAEVQRIRFPLAQVVD